MKTMLAALVMTTAMTFGVAREAHAQDYGLNQAMTRLSWMMARKQASDNAWWASLSPRERYLASAVTQLEEMQRRHTRAPLPLTEDCLAWTMDTIGADDDEASFVLSRMVAHVQYFRFGQQAQSAVDQSREITQRALRGPYGNW